MNNRILSLLFTAVAGLAVGCNANEPDESKARTTSNQFVPCRGGKCVGGRESAPAEEAPPREEQREDAPPPERTRDEPLSDGPGLGGDRDPGFEQGDREEGRDREQPGFEEMGGDNREFGGGGDGEGGGGFPEE
jgi:hypothetical protein